MEILTFDSDYFEMLPNASECLALELQPRSFFFAFQTCLDSDKNI